MLALVAAAGAQLDAGSVGLAVARRWSESGEAVLFVDAGAAGSGLAQRLGEADRADYSPAVRGLPSLMVAREPITLRLLADHCYSLGTSHGSLWALLAPSHPAGAQRAAAWLDERAAGLRAVDVERRVVVSSSLSSGAGLIVPLLKAARVVVVLAPVESLDGAKALWETCRGAGLQGLDRGLRVLIVEGDSPLSDDDIRVEAGMPVAGRLPVVADDRVLRLQGGRRDRAFVKSLDRISSRLLAASNLDAAQGAGPGRGREPAAQAPAQPEAARHPQAVPAGSVPAEAPVQPVPARHPGAVSAGSVPAEASAQPVPARHPGAVSAGSVPTEAPVQPVPARHPGAVSAGSVPAEAPVQPVSARHPQAAPAGSVPAGEPPDGRPPAGPMPPGSVLSGSAVPGSVPPGEAPGPVPAREGSARPEPGPEADPPERSPIEGVPAPGHRTGEQGREPPGRRRTGRRRRF